MHHPAKNFGSIFSISDKNSAAIIINCCYYQISVRSLRQNEIQRFFEKIWKNKSDTKGGNAFSL
jgi:hypothetical protein